MIKKVLQGTLVGIGSILPGVSGGMIAAAFNIYANLISALDLFTKAPIKAISSIWEYLVGILIGMIFGFLIVLFLFQYIPIPATLLFIGLILGGIPDIYLLSKEAKVTAKSIIVVTLSAFFMLALVFVNAESGVVNDVDLLSWLIVGFVMAISFIIPGLSGTMILMMIGYFIPLTKLPSNIINSLINQDYTSFFNYGFSALFLLLGVIITFLLMGKLLNLILKKNPTSFYQVVLGIIIVSPITIIISVRSDLLREVNGIDIYNISEHWLMWLIGLLLIPAGFYIARIFSKGKDETEKS